METELHRCECPSDARGNPNSPSQYVEEEEKAMYHAPNECPGTYKLALYNRQGTLLHLCSCCNLSGDRKVHDA